MTDRSQPDSSQHFVLGAKIKTVRRPPDSAPIAFEREADLQALVAGWPWLKGLPGLLLVDEPTFWLSDGGARADLLGISSQGRAVAAELLLDPFSDRKAALRSAMRGLHRLVTHAAELSRQGAYKILDSAPLIAVIVGDGAVFPRDVKQLKTLAKDFRHLCEVQQPSWSVEKGGRKEDRITPGWLLDQAVGRIELHAAAVERRLDGDSPVISVRRYRLV